MAHDVIHKVVDVFGAGVALLAILRLGLAWCRSRQGGYSDSVACSIEADGVRRLISRPATAFGATCADWERKTALDSIAKFSLLMITLAASDDVVGSPTTVPTRMGVPSPRVGMIFCISSPESLSLLLFSYVSGTMVGLIRRS